MGESKSSLSGLFKSGIDKLGISSSFPAVGSLQSTLRQQATMYNPHQLSETLKIQLAIKSTGSVAATEEGLVREQKLQSKNLYQWGKAEAADLSDVTDRIAFLVFKSAELQEAHSKRVAQSRVALKDIRNFENDLVPKRNRRKALEAKLASLRQKADKRAASEVATLSAELEQAEREDATFESSLEVLKRQKLHEAFELHFESQRELGEKQAILAGYGVLLLQGMDVGGIGDQYTGSERSAAIRAEVVTALDAWSPAKLLIPTPELHLGGSSFLGRSDTGSFGSTHAHELSQLDSNVGAPSPSFSQAGHSPEPSSPSPPALPTRPVPIPTQQDSLSSLSTAPLVPAPIPVNLAPTSPPPVASANFSPPISSLNADQQAVTSPTLPTIAGVPAGPTVAETGAPITGTGGPSSGQLAPRPPLGSEIAPISLASVGTVSGDQAKREEAAAERARADASFGSAEDARSDLFSPGVSQDDALSSREQAVRWKEAEAAKDRLAATAVTASGSGEGSGVNRMATTSRRRLEANEAAFGEAPPAYEGVDEDVVKAARQ